MSMLAQLAIHGWNGIRGSVSRSRWRSGYPASSGRKGLAQVWLVSVADQLARTTLGRSLTQRPPSIAPPVPKRAPTKIFPIFGHFAGPVLPAAGNSRPPSDPPAIITTIDHDTPGGHRLPIFHDDHLIANHGMSDLYRHARPLAPCRPDTPARIAR